MADNEPSFKFANTDVCTWSLSPFLYNVPVQHPCNVCVCVCVCVYIGSMCVCVYVYALERGRESVCVCVG